MSAATVPAFYGQDGRQTISEIFHSLSQPLTALHTSLELALLRDKTPQQLRSSMEAALENAERLRHRLLFSCELFEAGDPGELTTLSLEQLLRELQEELLPLAEVRGQQLELRCIPVEVLANGPKLTRAFFYLLEFLLRASAESARISIETQRRGSRIEIILESNAGATAPEDKYCQTEIARRTFAAVGGGLRLGSSLLGHACWTAWLPMANI